MGCRSLRRYCCDCTTLYKEVCSASPLCAQRCKSARNFSVCSRDAESPLLQLRVRPSRRRVLFGAQNEAIFSRDAPSSLLMHDYPRERRLAFYIPRLRLQYQCVVYADTGNSTTANARGKSKEHGQLWLEEVFDDSNHLLNEEILYNCWSWHLRLMNSFCVLNWYILL